MVVTMYIKPDDEKTYEQIRKYANDSNRGIGYVFCELWREAKDE